MLHNYQAKSIVSCLDSRKVVFIGDSTIRQIFWATAKKLNREKAEIEMNKTEEHSDVEFRQEGARIDFIWDPFLNSSKLRGELMAYKNEGLRSTSQTGQHRESASLILIGGGLWYARYIPVNPLKHFKDGIDRVVHFMASASSTSASNTGRARSFSKKVGSSNFLLLTPVQSPWYESLSPPRSETITRDKVDTMNEYLQQLSAFQDVDVIWSYSLMIYQQPDAYDETGIHVMDSVAAKKADILLNLRCNAETAAKDNQRYPFNKTCCSNYRYPGWVQWIILFAGLLVLPGLYLTQLKGWTSISRGVIHTRYRNSEWKHQLGQFFPSSKLLHALTVFTLSLCYCFYADRSQIFNKLHKQYSSQEFTTLCLLTLTLGILSIRRSVGLIPRNQKSSQTQPQQDQPFLSRDQTDEWKGWMQFIILIYHYTGASKVLWVYEIVRLLVASYLFMTGFGHTVFFLKKRDYSFRRVAAVLVRLNLLSCALPYMMRTDYLFYYFAPLVTFWFIVIYLTLKAGHSHNDNVSFLLMKIVLSTVLVTAVIRIHGVLELIFTVLKYSCQIHWDVKEWRFRVFLDMFIVYVGMICGVLFVKSGSSGGTGGMNAYVRGHRLPLRAVIISISIIILPTYITLARRFPNKFHYNRWQPYISPLPILAFVVLRNSHRYLRNFYSSIFAWLGRCSLETFILQFHIWLAGDTKGLLSIGILDIRGPEKWIEFAVLTVTFFWISWCVAGATSSITDWIISGGEKSTAMDDRSTSSMDDEGSTEINGNGTAANSYLHGDDMRFKRDSAWTNWVGSLWRKDLRVRIGMMLFVMWVLNLVGFISQLVVEMLYVSKQNS